MPAASLGLNELIEAATATGCRCILYGEYTPAPKLLVFLPDITIATNDTKKPSAVVCGMTLFWNISPKTLEATNKEPVIGQMHTLVAHPHINRQGVFDSRAFCRGSNTALMSVAAKSGGAIEMIGASIVTIRDYYAGSSYRRALSEIPIDKEYATACRCMGGVSVCPGCPSSGPHAVTPSGYKDASGFVPCSGCEKSVVGSTIWVDGKPYCENCATVYDGVGYRKESCVLAAVNGGKQTIPEEATVKCRKCSLEYKVDCVSREYAKICPVPGCEARESCR